MAEPYESTIPRFSSAAAGHGNQRCYNELPPEAQPAVSDSPDSGSFCESSGNAGKRGQAL
jgi:hypothetical protein